MHKNKENEKKNQIKGRNKNTTRRVRTISTKNKAAACEEEQIIQPGPRFLITLFLRHGKSH